MTSPRHRPWNSLQGPISDERADDPDAVLPADEVIDEVFSEGPEDGEPRSADNSGAINLLIAAAALALTSLAFNFRDGTGVDFVDIAISELISDIVKAFGIGQLEFGAVADTVAAEQFAEKAAAVQAPYLQGFATDIAAGALSDAEIARRSTMFGGALWPSYQAGRVEGAQSAVTAAGGAEANVDLWLRWIDTGDEAECGDCDALHESEWKADEIPFFPGDGHTVCLSNCRCELEIFAKPKGENDG